MPEQEAAPAAPDFRAQVEAAEQEAPQQEAPEQTEGEQPEKVAEKVERVVPLAALHEERANRKQLQQELRQQQQLAQQLQNQQVEMMRYLQQMQNPQQPAPDPSQDPLGFQSHKINEVVGKVDQLGQVLTLQQQQKMQEQQAQHQERQVQQFRGAVEQLEKRFSETTPDYHEAVQWAMQKKYQEYTAVGMPHEDADQRIRWEAWQIAQMAAQRGENPAEVAYKLAQTIGYKPKGVTAQQKLAMQAQGQAAATPGSGGSGGGRLSLDSLAKLKGTDFLEATKGDKWRQMMQKF